MTRRATIRHLEVLADMAGLLCTHLALAEDCAIHTRSSCAEEGGLRPDCLPCEALRQASALEGAIRKLIDARRAA